MNLVEELRDEAKWCETRSTPGWLSARDLYLKAADALDAKDKRITELEAKIEELEEAREEARWSAMGEDL